MDYEISKINGERYLLKDVVRVIDQKQMKLYIKHEVYPIDMYTTTDIETKEDKLVMLFSRKESQPLYILWKNRELKQMNRFKEKELYRYVIADLSQPTNYIMSLRNANYCLIDNILKATKFASKKVAEDICSECIRNTNIDLVVVPLMITYEIIEE